MTDDLFLFQVDSVDLGQEGRNKGLYSNWRLLTNLVVK
jgi:hypothetical protein